MQGPPEVSVVLPTLREAETLRMVGPRIREALRPYAAEILVVDDNSQDGTPEVVRALAETGPFRLLTRIGRRGLASAVLEGFGATTGRVIVVIDADGSHPPELLPSLIEPVREGAAELVLASRHVPGGDAGDMGPVRRWISRSAALLARPLTPVRDPVSGYFALRREILARAPLRPIGYKIGLEILVKCRPKPVREVPFRFGARLAGQSKLSGQEIGKYVRHLGRLYGFRLGSPFLTSSTR